ncbi:sensor histidine kinase [Paenibacillus planticolens]|uniref:histidine kinase n=1 Tax=Paenibacillus planticolens TaxID=2654976 RepID=A0ABX1ZQG4_9BACL|nr:ATP-binding protein [Paenibacillus planticolens]NOV02319.1 GHKL domain-containing protein [Paenibacillus planticolens]
MQHRFKSESMRIIFIAILVAIAGEFKVTPFNGELFRIGLGSSTFLLLLLLMRQLPVIKTGIVVAATVLIFRMLSDLVTMDQFDWLVSSRKHCSAMLYYMVFAVGIRLIQQRLEKLHPLVLGICISVIDFVSNEFELLARSFVFHQPFIPSGQWMLIAVIAVIRSYFTIGLYSSITVSQMRIVHAEQQKRMEQMLSIGSGLYGEVFYIKKSMDAIEQITAKSYNLYCQLQSSGGKEFSRPFLEITQQIHEVKKDSQRILAGLMKLSDRETASELTLTEVVQFVVKSNYEYSAMLNKEVRMLEEMLTDYTTSHYIPLLTVLGNLVSNAVESIDRQGLIVIKVFEYRSETVLVVTDTGPGINEHDKDMIFKPGFTTKFNQEGVAATGIGLSHVWDIVSSYGGEIRLESDHKAFETSFIVRLPTVALKKGAS